MNAPSRLPAPARTIDTSGKLCPFPIVETAKAVRALDDGAVLLVIATDPGIATDMPMWCKATRNEHIATFRDGASFKSYVRKQPRRASEGPAG
ncbi:MAG TPA: sulfurtransferase TusA family protein, partial [Anaeromyxobacteraceae bacterium]|nr:sulfurtransferase TusA family protein [Anaeromyxobacteraceae bacterium]